MNDIQYTKATAAILKRGEADGKAAGSWVVDGNTSDETCAKILRGLDDGDPTVADSLPQLQLGEWADDPSFEEILSSEGVEIDDESDPETVDDLFGAYSDAWYEGMVNEVERACRARSEVSS